MRLIVDSAKFEDADDFTDMLNGLEETEEGFERPCTRLVGALWEEKPEDDEDGAIHPSGCGH